jgi:hypothetical protein
MNTTQSTLSSPRNQRILFWIGLLALTAGIVVLVIKLAGGSDSTATAPDKTFKPVLPAKTTTLRASNGAKVTSYEQLPSQVKQAIVGFVTGGVLHNDYGASWKYTAPNITHGASQHKWATVDARSVIPLPGYTLNGVTYRLEGATTKEILVSMTLQPSKPSVGRPVPMRIGLSPYGSGAKKRWLVDYWLPATNESAVPYNPVGGG